MKPRNLRSLTLLAGLLIIAVIVLGLIPLNPGSKAALDRKGNDRFTKVRNPAAENLDVRNRFQKVSQSKAVAIKKSEGKVSGLRAGVPESMLKAKERLEREAASVLQFRSQRLVAVSCQLN